MIGCSTCHAENPHDAKFCGSCGVALPTPNRADTNLIERSFCSGRYLVIRELGEGRSKKVFLCKDQQLGRKVAFAFLKGDREAEDVERLMAEAKTLAALDHPHIVTLHDLDNDEGRPYVVTEYLEGGSLADRLRGGDAPLEMGEILGVAHEVCDALAYAHSRGVIHRDIKPANIWLTSTGIAKLGDFGLAKTPNRTRQTLEGLIIGTVHYLAPEHVMGGPAGERSDLYSLGATLYETVCGRPPFEGDSTLAIVSQHLTSSPVAPHWFDSSIPPDLNDLILALLEKSPDQRPKSSAIVKEMVAAIRSAPQVIQTTRSLESDSELDRLPGDVFVGRQEEVAALTRVLNDTLSGTSNVAMIHGEAGIGKTRLAAELATYAALRNVKVEWGRCYEGEGAPPYWPWVQILRSYIQKKDKTGPTSHIGNGANELVRIVPELASDLPNHEADAATNESIEQPGELRLRLFDAVTSFVRNAALDQPLLLIVDNMQWADAASILLFEHVASRIRDVPVLLLATYRDSEVDPEGQLAISVKELTGRHVALDLTVHGLSQIEIRRLLEITAGAFPEALSAELYKITDGNPLFANEFVRLLAAERRLESHERWSVTLPQGIKEVVLQRIRNLSDECVDLLKIISVLGGEFETKLVAALSRLPAEVVQSLVTDAIRGRVLEGLGDGRWRFSNALMQTTLYEELSATRRARLHLAAAEAIEILYSNDLDRYLAELAHHYSEGSIGGDKASAISYLVKAGRQAAGQLAYEEAVGYFEKALVFSDEASSPERCGLLLSFGDALWRSGNTAGAKGTFLVAAEMARALESPELLAQASLGYACGYGGFGFESRPDPTLISLLEESLAAIGEEDSALRVRVLCRMALELYFMPEVERREALSREALEIARRIDDDSVLLTALFCRTWATINPSNLSDRLAIAPEILRLAEQLSHRELLFLGHHLSLSNMLETGDIDAVDREMDICLRVADELGHPLYIWLATCLKAMRALIDGNFEAADSFAQESMQTPGRGQSEVAIGAFAVLNYLIAWVRGELPAIEGSVEYVAENYPWLPAWKAALAYVYADADREESARAQFESLAADDFASLPWDGYWLCSLCMLALTCHYLGDRDRARTLYDLISPYEDLCVLAGQATVSMGSVATFLGILAHTMGRWDDGIRLLEKAISKNDQMTNRPFLAVTCFEYAALLVDSGSNDSELVDRMIARAREISVNLGMKRLLERVEDLAGKRPPRGENAELLPT